MPIPALPGTARPGRAAFRRGRSHLLVPHGPARAAGRRDEGQCLLPLLGRPGDSSEPAPFLPAWLKGRQRHGSDCGEERNEHSRNSIKMKLFSLHTCYVLAGNMQPALG